jgi:Cytochrome P460
MSTSQGTTTITMPSYGGRTYPSEKRAKKTDKNMMKPIVPTENAQTEPMKVETKPATETDSHGFSYGVVYANEIARAEFEKPNPQFAVGSIIVREKIETPTGTTPQLVIAMVKREKGFSAETGDWEFFVFNGADFKLQKRETKSDCAACHIKAEKTDWVFREYLNK